MASNVLLLTILGAGCVCVMCCTSSLIFIRHQRDLAKDVLLANTELSANEALIAALNAKTPPPVPKADPILAKPQDLTEKTGTFNVPWWQGCLVSEKDRINYKEGDPSTCDTSLVRVPVDPFRVSYPQHGFVNDAFMIKSGTQYVGRDFKFTTDFAKAVKLRRDPASGTLEVVTDDNRLTTRACWNIRSKKLYEEKDRTKYKTCALWEIP